MTLGDVAARLVEIKKERADLETQDGKLVTEDQRLKKLAVDLLDQGEIDSFEINGVGKITRKANVRGITENPIDFFFWLAARGDESVAKLQIDATMVTPALRKQIKAARPDQISLAIAWNGFERYLKDVCDPLDAETWPPGVKVDFWEDVRVTVKK